VSVRNLAILVADDAPAVCQVPVEELALLDQRRERPE
jgi:hypothetical protein